LGPGNMPDAIVQKIYQDTNKCLQEPGLRSALSNAVSGYVVDGSTPEQFTKQIKDDFKRYSEILKRINLQTS
jgi:tripartite-type tricarboxylate transporter receptor subunit TctC